MPEDSSSPGELHTDDAPPFPDEQILLIRGPVTEALEHLVDTSQPLSRFSDPLLLNEALPAWEADARELDTFTAQPDRPWVHRRWPVAVAEDPRFVAQLITYQEEGWFSRASYFVPVLAAWSFLGAAELWYSRDGAANRSFFSWWSDQTVGPWVFSGGLAFLILILMALERSRSKRGSRRQALQLDFESVCVRFSQILTTSLSDWEARRPSTTQDLGAANAALALSAASITQVAKTLESGERSSDAVAVTRSLTSALSALDSRLSDMVTESQSLAERNAAIVQQTAALAAIARDVPDRLSGWADDLRHLADLRESVAAHAEATRAASELFADGTRQLLERLPMAEVALNRSHELTEALLRAEERLEVLLTSTDRNRREIAESVASEVAELRRVVEALTTAGGTVVDLAERLRFAVSVADSLHGPGA